MNFLTGCLKDSLDVNLWNEVSNLLGRTVTEIVYESLDINKIAKKFKAIKKLFLV
jgi:hypothetical protein